MVQVIPFLFVVVIGSEIRDERPTLNIDGMKVAKIQNAPFTAAVFEEFEEGIRVSLLCTASIIAENWVLTAAHCFPQPRNVLNFAAGTNTASDIVNSFDYNDAEDGHVQIRTELRTIKHPKYRKKAGRRYDVALHHVDSWKFGTYVDRIQLYAEDWNGEEPTITEYAVKRCTSYGWGKTEPNDTQAFLRTSDFDIRHGYQGCDCLKPFTNQRILCNGPPEHSVCPGISGGPLVCDDKLAGVAFAEFDHDCSVKPNSSWKGLISRFFEDSLAEPCGSKEVSGWIYVCPVIDWIKTIVPDVPEPPLSCQCPSLLALSQLSILALAVTIP